MSATSPSSPEPAGAPGGARAWLAPLLRPLWPRFRELVVFSLCVNLLALATPIFILQVYDRVVFHGGISTLEGLTLGMALVVAFDFVMRQARSRLMQRVALRIDVDIARRLQDKLARLPLRVLESRPARYWQSLFRDAEQVRNLVGGPTAVLLVDLPFVALSIGLIAVIAAPIVWVLATALVGFVGLAVWSSWSIQNAARAERHAGLGRDGLVGEVIAGRTTVKALALAESIGPQWEARHAEAIDRALHRGVRIDGFGNAGAALAVSTTVALVAFGALAILDHRMTIGALVAANMLGGRIISPLNQLVGAWRGFASSRESARRLSEAFALAEERTESAIALERPDGIVTLEDVSFAFSPEGPPAVHGVGLVIKPGGLHGIVGRNGSGKSTLLKLMMGLYVPDRGRVLLGGADILQLSRRDLSTWIGYVPQETFLFAGTIRDNVAIRRPDADDAAVIEAARLAGLHEAVLGLADGYATEIGEAGQRLSVGLRQRIAIARALLGDPPVLLLDEPTASLDREAEERLRTTLSELARERNVVIVTHSPILLVACNNIVVMERGRVAMAGPASEIMPKLYAGHRHNPPLDRRK